MDTLIRRADPPDAATVALLGRITFAETFGHLFRDRRDELRAYLDATFDVPKIEASLRKPGNAYWLAFRRRLPAGYAKLKHPSAAAKPLPPATVRGSCDPDAPPQKPEAQLQKIYVLGAFLGEAIGRALFDHVLREAARRAPGLWLDVLQENHRAIRFYERNGFSKAGEDTYTIGTQTFRFDLMARPTA